MPLTKIEFRCKSIDGRPVVGAEDATHRYHIWLDDVFQQIDNMVYKNPLVRDNTAPYRPTVKLDRTKGMGKPIAAAMMAAITPESISAWHVERKRLIAVQTAEHAAAKLANAKRQHANDMFDTLNEIAANDPFKRSSAGILAHRILDKINKASS